MSGEELKSALQCILSIGAAKAVVRTGVNVHLVRDTGLFEDRLQLVGLVHRYNPIGVAVEDQNRRETPGVELLPFGKAAEVLHDGRHAAIASAY